MTDSPLLAAALAYARLGYSVMPLRPGDKRPLMHEWKPLQKKPLSEADILGFWQEVPNANVGILTGQISNISVIDIDGPAGVTALKALGINLPSTRVYRTPHGWHYIYRFDARFKQGSNHTDSVDVRGEGGYIVAPPSVVDTCTKDNCPIVGEHPRDYRVLRDTAVVEYPDVPEVFQRIRKETTGTGPDLGEQPAWVAGALLNGAGEGQRNDMASRLAGYFRSVNLPQDIALAALRQFAAACNPPMHFEELVSVVKSVWRYQPSRVSTYQGQGMETPIVEESISTRRLFRWPTYGIMIRADRIKESGDSVNCWLTISTSEAGEIYGPVGFNLLADRSRTGLAKSLKERHEANWLGILDMVAKEIIQSITQTGLSEDAADIVAGPASTWLAYPILKTEQPTLLYADGGSGKSSWTTTLLVSLAIGRSLLPGIRIDTAIPVFYLDWEGTRDEFGALRSAIEKAHGVTVPKSMLRYRRMRLPLPDELDSVQREINEWGIKVVAIDSIVGAAGEDVEKAEGARLHFNCLAQMNTASVNLTHITKDGKNAKPYGSVFYWNYARSVWFGQRDEDEDAFAIYHKKANYSKLFNPFTWQSEIAVDSNDRLISLAFRSANVHDFASLSAITRVPDQIEGLLRQRILSTEEIIEIVGGNPQTIRTALRRGKEKGRWLQVPPSMGWGLAARDNKEHVASMSRNMSRGDATLPPFTGRGIYVAPSQPGNDEKGKDVAGGVAEPW